MKTWREMSFGLLLAGGLLAQGVWAGEWIADAKGCKTWNFNPVAGESIFWDGACLDGYIDGEGVLQWFKNGKLNQKYTGIFKKGYLTGKGGVVFENGNRYEGDFVDGKITGIGVYYYAGGDRYDGNFVNGFFHGKGVIIWSGNRYEGDFLNGERTGKGVVVFNNGNRYEGDFVGGYFHGKGVYLWKDGDRYEGDFVKGKRTGKGIYAFASGNRYEGDLIDGDSHGKGVFTWKNGDRYEGDYVKGKRTGKGIIVFANGNRYEGDFVDEVFHGKGVFTWKDGDRYEGEFVKGKRTGKGVFAFANGSRYEGDFVDGRLHGRGLYILSNGNRYEGDLVKGNFTGNGIYTWKNGITYTGEFVDDKRTGFGTVRVPHGAYVGKERSNKGKWKMEEGFSYFEERGIFKNNEFIMACANKNACEDIVREPCRAEFRNAASSSELNSFIEKYKDNDPDGLVPQARKKIPAAQKYEREQERLAAIKRAKEEREAYRTAFKNASSSSDLSAFVERYKNNDPEKLVPKARQKIPAAQKRERDQSAKQEREYAARSAQECGRLYPGKLVSWTARMCEGRVLGLFGGGCYDEKFQGIIVGGGKGIATAKITKPSHKSGEYSERSCSDFN